MDSFVRERCEITSVEVKDGMILCNAESLDEPAQEYSEVIYGNSNSSLVEVPRIGEEVVVETLNGDYIATHTLSIPNGSGGSKSDMEAGALNQAASMTLVLGPRDGADSPETISVEYRSDGYVLDVDIDGDLTISAGGDVKISRGGTAKKVLTEDAVFEYEDTGDTSDGTASATTKQTSKVVNGEKTDVELE